MKKFFSLLLALTLCLNLCIPALADAGASSFTDVKEGDWYYAAVQWAVAHDITKGVSDTEFGVNNTVTRAQMVTFLWRMAGSPEPLTVKGFTDVPAGAWYADAVNWAAERGIANGTSETTFSPDGGLTREQAAAFLYREEQRRGGGFTGMWAFPLSYGDADTVADYAYEPLCWLTMQEIMKGSDGLLAPRGLCSRAQLVTMLYRYVEELEPQEEPAYTEKKVPVLRDSLKSTETATLRYYEDMPNVPYMSLTQYYNQFYLLGTDRKEGVTDSRLGTHHVLTNIAGYTAEIDTRTDTIVTDDLESFVSLAYYLDLTLSGEADENYPFLLGGYSKTTPETPTPLTLRLGDYGIDLRGGEDGLYLPLATLGDIYATTELVWTVFNGEKIYLQDYGGNFLPSSALAEDDDFAAPLKAARGEDLTDFTYRELCFNIDTFYGQPGQEYIHEALENGKLDDILSESYPDVKELLCSADFTEYFTGLNLLLHGLLFDGGHTGITSAVMSDQELVQNAVLPLMEKDYGADFMTMAFKTVFGAVQKTLQDQLYGDDYYVEKGDTAMIRFDAFLVDSAAWKAFYAGEGEMPLEGDTLGTIYAGLQRAAANPAIKNVVIDISCNGGGDSGAMNAIEWLMTGKGYINFENRLTGQVNTGGSGVDINFDGVFDEKDQPMTQFRYGVLTSVQSFSCGNAFPFFMKEHGAMILGQQSGGGACAIRISTAGGIEFASSAATSRIVTDAGKSVDSGCPVDLELYQEPDSEDVDMENITDISQLPTGYEHFYDLDAISAGMNEFFGTAQGAAA